MTIITEHIQPLLETKRIPAALVAAFLLPLGLAVRKIGPRDGKVMFNEMTVFALALAGVLTATDSAGAADASAPNCALKQLASLPISNTADGMISVPVKVNDSAQQFVAALDKPYTAIVSHVVDDQELITRQMGSEVNLASISYMGDTSSEIAYLPRLGVGSLSIANVKALVLHTPRAENTTGVLGDDVFSQLDVELNLKGGKLNLFSSQHCPGNVVYWGRPYVVLPMSFDSQGVPEFSVNLDGKPVTVKLASEDAGATMNGASAKALFGIEPPPLPPAKKQRLRDIMRGPPPTFDLGPPVFHSFKELNFEGVTIKNLQAAITPDDGGGPCRGEQRVSNGIAERCFGGYDLSLGRGELKQLRLYFAFQEKKLYVTSADPDAAPNLTSGDKISPGVAH